jgi:hypothetical protein
VRDVQLRFLGCITYQSLLGAGGESFFACAFIAFARLAIFAVSLWLIRSFLA